MSIRAGVCSDRPWVTPAHPGNHRMSPSRHGQGLLCLAELRLPARMPRENQEFWALAQPLSG